MITPLTYGHTGFTSMGYYYVGIAGNYAKLGLPGPVVEAGWMTAQQVNFSFPISNLASRKVDTYSNVKSSLRFFQGITGTNHVIPLFSKRALAVPIDPLWAPYS